MIPLKRGPAPEFFASALSMKVQAAARSYFAKRLSSRRQRRFAFAAYFKALETALHKPLQELSHGKCAFCETPLSRASPKVVPFRPFDGVGEASGEYLGDHYWAQAFEWSNYYASCEKCARYKGKRFPVSGSRAAADATGLALASEDAALLSPDRDEPDTHLSFLPNGQVAGRTDRGRQTIEIFGLARSDLVQARSLEAKRFLAEVRTRGAAITSLLADDQPFAALRRQLWAAERPRPKSTEAKSTQATAVSAQQKFEAMRANVATESQAGLENYRARARFIERVQIRNFLSIERLDLDLSLSEAERAPCFTVLGENAVGKSSVLKAIAYTLGGAAYLERLGARPADLLRQGSDEGSVSVWVSGFKDPAVMQFTRRARKMRFAQEHSRALILGYGSSRLLPTEKHRPKHGMKHAKIDNLFDPFLPLTDARAWLASATSAQFDEAALRIKQLLLLPDDAGLVRTSGKHAQVYVEFRPPPRSRKEPTRHALGHLSDGYQSMLGFATDLMEIMFGQGYTSMDAAQGVVLIDELGNHLHPRWRMQIVGRLRAAFPNVQFVFSTHDPLCLRGLLGGEIVVLQLDARRKVYALTDLPSITGLRVDQLLRSEHFGLGSTIEPEMQQDYERYLVLKRQSPRDATADAEFQRLEKSLFEARVLASSPQERAVLEFMEEERQRGPTMADRNLSAAKITEGAKEQLRKLFSKAGV